MLTADMACAALLFCVLTTLGLAPGVAAVADPGWNPIPFIVIAVLSLWLCADHSGRTVGSWQTLKDFLAAMTVFLALSTGYASLLAEPHPAFSEMALLWGLSLTAMALSQTLGLRDLRWADRREMPRRKALIVGTGRVAQDMARRLTDKPEYGCLVHGFISERQAEVGGLLDGIPVLGTFSQVSSVVESGVELVVICLPASLEAQVETLLRALRNSTVDVKLIPAMTSIEHVVMDAYMFEGLPIMTLQGSPVQGWHAAGKRALDIVGSAVGLCLAIPLFIMIAILIKASSPGPVLYRQVRMSLAGRPFVMLKFRTMHDQAERNTGPVWAVANDARATKLGRLLRKACLDELPQLWNVLKGEMSLVGPRPERPTYIETFRQTYPTYMLRHKVKAGMTGWAQINGWRGNTCIQTRIAHDLYYIQHWSLWFDLKILCQTLWKGVLHENAY